MRDLVVRKGRYSVHVYPRQLLRAEIQASHQRRQDELAFWSKAIWTTV